MYSGRDVKAYGYDDYFKVPSVFIVTAMTDATTKQPKQEERKQKKAGGLFEELFENACKEVERQEDVTCHTNGYTKDAKSFSYNIIKHNYI